MDVLVFGSLNIDFTCYVDRLPCPGETIEGNKFKTWFGGKGANQCVAAAKLGANTAMVGKLGGDFWGTQYLDVLRNEKININFVDIIEEEMTGMAQITVAANGENAIVIIAGANNKLSEFDVDKADKLFKTAKVLLCQMESPYLSIVKALRNFKGISILNVAPANHDISLEFITLPNIICINETEAKILTGLTSVGNLVEAKSALNHLIEMGSNTVIITMGSLGAVYSQRIKRNIFIHVPAPTVDSVVDTTGAGDAFIGALAYVLSHFPDAPLHQCIGAACTLAAESVTKFGSQDSFSRTKITLKNNEFEWNHI